MAGLRPHPAIPQRSPSSNERPKITLIYSTVAGASPSARLAASHRGDVARVDVGQPHPAPPGHDVAPHIHLGRVEGSLVELGVGHVLRGKLGVDRHRLRLDLFRAGVAAHDQDRVGRGMGAR